jgi:hypothetical protein
VQAEKPETDVLQARVQNLEAQLQTLRAEKVLLEEKLKEALAVRPASIDPQELAKAQEQIRTLRKENELLTATLEAQKAAPARPADTNAVVRVQKVQKALDDSTRQLAAEREANARLRRELEALQKQAHEARRSATDERASKKERETSTGSSSKSRIRNCSRRMRRVEALRMNEPPGRSANS